LSAEKTFYGAGSEVTLHVSIANPGTTPTRVLKWLIPSEGFTEPLFSVTRDGEAVDYIGMLVKRLPPSEADYITLKAGESLSRNLDLSDYYDLSASGNYEVKNDALSADPYAKTGEAAGRLASNTLTLFIEGRAPSLPEAGPFLAVTGTTTFNSCSASQQTALINARNAASNYATDAVNYFLANLQGARYTTWFGVYNLTRYNTVKNHFNNISNAMDTANPMNFDCTCPDVPDPANTYAYVFPNQPYTIHLYGAFWNAPMTGTDSKAGTLIHETSHFLVVAGTLDYTYGQTSCEKSQR